MNNYQKLCENLRELKLTQVSLKLEEYIVNVNDRKISLVDALYELTEKELEIKNFNATNSMVKVAGFPHLKEMKDFDFDFQPKINKQQFLDFQNLRFLESNSNIILIGNSGVGKTHLATSIGIAAAKKRVSTYFNQMPRFDRTIKKSLSRKQIR